MHSPGLVGFVLVVLLLVAVVAVVVLLGEATPLTFDKVRLVPFVPFVPLRRAAPLSQASSPHPTHSPNLRH